MTEEEKEIKRYESVLPMMAGAPYAFIFWGVIQLLPWPFSGPVDWFGLFMLAGGLVCLYMAKYHAIPTVRRRIEELREIVEARKAGRSENTPTGRRS